MSPELRAEMGSPREGPPHRQNVGKTLECPQEEEVSDPQNNRRDGVSVLEHAESREVWVVNCKNKVGSRGLQGGGR